jgi:hypothetical protein
MMRVAGNVSQLSSADRGAGNDAALHNATF